MKIDEIQRQYMYKVQPVQLFDDNNRRNIDRQNLVSVNQTNNPFNLNHPFVKNTSTANNLDLLA